MENIKSLKDLNGKINEALSFVRNKIEGFIPEDEAKWMAIAMFLLGVIVGMLISPRKNLSFGSNNSYSTTNDYSTLDDDCCECIEDGESCECE